MAADQNRSASAALPVTIKLAQSGYHWLPRLGRIGTGVARMLQLCGPLKVSNCSQTATATNTAAASANAALADDIAALSALETNQKQHKGATSIEMLAANRHGAPNVASLNVIKAENWE